MRRNILFILLIPLFCFAGTGKWDVVKLSYDFHFKGVGGVEKLMSPEGRRVIEENQKFISAPENREIFETQEGKDFLTSHAKYLNFLKVKETLDACENDKNSARKLEKAIVAGIVDNDIVGSNCRNKYLLTLKTVSDLKHDVDAAMLPEMRKEFQDRVTENSLVNSMDAYLRGRYRYEPDFMKAPLSSSEKEEIVEKICERQCSDEMKIRLFEHIGESQDTLRKGEPKVSMKEAAKSINERVDRLNEKLRKVKFKSDGSFSSKIPWIDDPDLEDDETQRQFNDYLKEYVESSSYGDGLLMHTGSLRKSMGTLRTLENDDHIDEDNSFSDATFKFEEHEQVDESDVKNAVKDMFKGIDGQLSKLHQLSRSKKAQAEGIALAKKRPIGRNVELAEKAYDNQRVEDVGFLVRTNPKAVSQFLTNNPEYASLVCDALIKIDEADRNATGGGDAWVWAGLGFFAAGLITGGVGWLVGAGALGLGTVTTGLLLASSASGVIGAGISLKEASDLNQEAMAIERGLLSGSSYATSSEKMRDSYMAYKDALYDASLNASLSVAGMGAYGALNRVFVSGGRFVGKAGELKVTKETLDTLSGMYRKIDKDAKLAGVVKKTVKELGDGGQQMMDEFLGKLAMMDAAVKNKVFTALTSGKMSSTKLAQLIRKNHCGAK